KMRATGARTLYNMPVSGALGDQAIYEKNNNGADNRSDPACSVTLRVPSHRLTQVGCNDRPDDTQNRGKNEPHGLVARHNGAGDQANNKTNHDSNDNRHILLLLK